MLSFFGHRPAAHNPTGALRHVRQRVSNLAGGWLCTTEQYRIVPALFAFCRQPPMLSRPIGAGAPDCSSGWQSFDFRMLAGLIPSGDFSSEAQSRRPTGVHRYSVPDQIAGENARDTFKPHANPCIPDTR